MMMRSSANGFQGHGTFQKRISQ